MVGNALPSPDQMPPTPSRQSNHNQVYHRIEWDHSNVGDDLALIVELPI